MRSSDWSSDVCSSDLRDGAVDDHELGVLPGDVRGKSFDLPRTEQRGRTRGSNANHFAPNGLKRYRRGKTYRLIQPRFARTPANAPEIGHNDKGAGAA